MVGRKGHPLGNAASIKALMDVDWIITGLRERIEKEFEEQIAALGLVAPRSPIVAESILALLSLLASGDRLAFCRGSGPTRRCCATWSSRFLSPSR